jgi:hypothetical protein
MILLIKHFAVLVLSIGSIYIYSKFCNQALILEATFLAVLVSMVTYLTLPKSRISKKNDFAQGILTIVISLTCYYFFKTYLN